MESKTKRLLLIGGSVVVIAGVAWYLFGKKKGVEEGDEDIDAAATDEATPTVTPTPATTPVALPVELNSMDKVKKFQDFMDSIGPWLKGSDGKYKKLSKGTGYGIAGPSTRAVFNVYGDLYRVYLLTSTKARIIPLTGAGSVASVDVDLSNGTIVRYQLDKKFAHFASAYGSVLNTGTWSNRGRKVVVNFGAKKGKTIDNTSIWDTLKALIS
jgi:hypothetical protein